MPPDQRRIVVCPQCGFGIKIDPTRKYVCKCGNGGGFLPEQPLSEWMIVRRNICENCPKFHNDRCDLIELGCRPEFIRCIRNEQAKCPLGKW